jgi:hypothetical protein
MKPEPLPKTESEHPGAMTDLGLRLSVRETCGEAIDRIVAIYARTKSMAKTAEKLQVGKRTLERWVDRTPELRRRIEAKRAELFPPR